MGDGRKSLVRESPNQDGNRNLMSSCRWKSSA
jgi:hypothetical protein